MSNYCGVDWAEGHHDIAIVDHEGKLVFKKRIGDDPAGFAQLTQLLADAGDTTRAFSPHSTAAAPRTSPAPKPASCLRSPRHR
ncbi:transposase, partial [Nocardia sp. NPDC004168]|uniref:IS110 family transposase n=1 Tax=Nocardia sp. NPDC004168 TaxID=3154452 RepID=UPI00339F3B3B